jgi:hypothetical protein
MGNYRDSCVLNWRGGKKKVPFQPTTNVLVFYMASSSRSYCAFAATFEAMEAPYFQREKVLEFPGCRDLMDDIVPEEFVVEENLNYDKEVSVNEGVTSVEPTVTTGTSQCGRVCKMSQRMTESVAQGMRHMAHQSTISETNEDLFHDAHLEL